MSDRLDMRAADVNPQEQSVGAGSIVANSARPLTWRDIRGTVRRHADELLSTEAEAAALEAFLANAPFNREGRRRLTAPVIDVPERLAFTPSPQMSTQQGFGLVLNEIARGNTELA